MLKRAVFGVGGFGREVLPMLKRLGKLQSNFVFVDDDKHLIGRKVNGVVVVSAEQAIAEGRQFTIAIASPKNRRMIVTRLEAEGAVFFQAKAKTAVTYDHVELGEGAILCDHVLLTTNIKIGKHFHANCFSYVAHDCVFGDYVTLAPHVSCGGRLMVGDGVYIGAGAVIKQGTIEKPLRIGKGAVIGMGAVVTKDVAPNVTVVGNPAKILEKK